MVLLCRNAVTVTAKNWKCGGSETILEWPYCMVVHCLMGRGLYNYCTVIFSSQDTNNPERTNGIQLFQHFQGPLNAEFETVRLELYTNIQCTHVDNSDAILAINIIMISIHNNIITIQLNFSFSCESIDS